MVCDSDLYKEIQKYLGQDWQNFLQIFADCVSTDIPLLEKANKFLLGHGGKKLRPLFTLLTAKALCGSCDEQVIRCAAAAELLHTGTLLHDDVVDESSIRRGAPTARALYSPTTAVLLGDFWLSRAIHLVVDHPDKRVLHIFAKCLGDLAEGEMIQLEKSQKGDTDEEAYRRIIYCKTTSLFEAAMLSAAYSVGAGTEETECMRRYAFHIGQSFQMADDILDYSPELSIGKPTGQDIPEGKVTLPLLALFARVPKSVSQQIRRRLKEPDAELVLDIFDMVSRYDALDYAREQLGREVALAVEALDPLPESEAKSYLIALAQRMALRTE